MGTGPRRAMGGVIGTSVVEAAHRLQAGELVAIPTETVYGLAANAFDGAAVARVFEAKRRPRFDPLIVHLPDRRAVRGVAARVPADAERLMEAFWPGPLTLVLPKRPEVPDLVTSGLPTVAVRRPDHALVNELLDALGFPLAAPSANRFGAVSPTTAAHVVEQLGDEIDFVLDGGPCTVGVESTIVDFGGGRCRLLRPGGVPVEELERVVGPVLLARSTEPEAPLAPGRLASHYAPRTPLELGDLSELLARHAGRRVGVLAFREPRPAHACRVLAPDGDLVVAARRLFAALRELDASGCEVLVAERAPDRGLGRAVNDRLERAAAARTAAPHEP